MTVTVLVCGGRDFANKPAFDKAMAEVSLRFESQELLLVSGGATGADTLAKNWAGAHNVEIHEYPADWLRNGNAAGPIRNRQMLDKENVTLVVAFPGGAGTRHMMRIARFAGIEVWEPLAGEGT